MRNGFIKVAAVSPSVHLAKPILNAGVIINEAKKAADNGAKVIVFPKLCITGVTCGDLFLQEALHYDANLALKHIAQSSAEIDAIIFVGTIWRLDGELYSVVVAINHGRILGIVPDNSFNQKGLFDQYKYFSNFSGGLQKTVLGRLDDGTVVTVPFGYDLTFIAEGHDNIRIGVDSGYDPNRPISVGAIRAIKGANIIVKCDEGAEIVGTTEDKQMAILDFSRRYNTGYIYASSGYGESTTNNVHTGYKLIGMLGSAISESDSSESIVYGTFDLKKTRIDRNKIFSIKMDGADYAALFRIENDETDISNLISKYPFIPERDKESRFNKIISLQARSLAGRMSNIDCNKAVIGLSGGLDSTLALMVTRKAFDILGYDKSGIIGITMPGPGTSNTTTNNVNRLVKALGMDIRTIDITDSFNMHLKDIGHSQTNHNIAYENAQARERAQILMDIANDEDAIVIGTSDMSELALGFTTYGGDHMSSYGVNAGIPKTLVREIVRNYPEKGYSEELYQVLRDIADEPISPELIPGDGGQIEQITEDIIGPYELHDFFLYYMVRYRLGPADIFRRAKAAFGDEYLDTAIIETMKKFYDRFFKNQFKRSCIPDGARIGTVSIATHGDFCMPSDVCPDAWQSEILSLMNDWGK